MDINVWLTFFLASWLISLSPGAGAIKSMSTGMRYGYRLGLFNILGLILGIIVLMMMVALGLGAILTSSALAFFIIKWLGVLYLVWLGLVQWHAKAAPIEIEEEQNHWHLKKLPQRLMVEGLLVNISNPKGIVFMLAVLPQFINPLTPQWPQYALCTATLVFTDFIVMSGYTLLAAKVLKALRSPLHIRWLNRIFGGLFITAGVLLGGFNRTEH